MDENWNVSTTSSPNRRYGTEEVNVMVPALSLDRTTILAISLFFKRMAKNVSLRVFVQR
jgi:hypothetical protein